MSESSFHIAENQGEAVAAFAGYVGAGVVGDAWPELARFARSSDVRRIVLDFENITGFDSAAPALAAAVQCLCRQRGIACEVKVSSPHFQRLLDAALQSADEEAASAPVFVDRVTAAPVWIGGAAIGVAERLRNALEFVGELTLALWDAVRRPRRVRGDALLAALQEHGVDAVPIVSLISFLIGAITAFQAAVQLHDFGADVYVADLAGLSITRELGPIMVAIICAGRSGAGMAAELGAMTVNDEVEAMHTMGLDVFRFLVTPRVLAMVAALPCLTLFGDVVGVFASMATSRVVLDLPFSVYWHETLLAVGLGDIFGGLAKTLVFAVLIAGVGCERGLHVGRDPRSVGRAATSAVVLGIFGIIFADAVFAVLYNILGI